jgi:hypothetical protein
MYLVRFLSCRKDMARFLQNLASDRIYGLADNEVILLVGLKEAIYGNEKGK